MIKDPIEESILFIENLRDNYILNPETIEKVNYELLNTLRSIIDHLITAKIDQNILNQKIFNDARKPIMDEIDLSDSLYYKTLEEIINSPNLNDNEL